MSQTLEFPKNSYPLNTYNGTQMNHKFVKHILADNSNDLSATLVCNYCRLWFSQILGITFFKTTFAIF